MSQSSPSPVKNRAVVIQKGNELVEFIRVLEDLAVPVDAQTGSCPNPAELAGAAVVIVPGSRLIELGNPNLSLWPRTFAVVDNKSKTLASHLNRLGVAMIIRRPIHPRTLRLLLLHEIYRGPERRSRKRVSIGHPIRTSGGLFKHAATLLELSLTGARLEMRSPPKIGKRITLLVGKEVTRAKPVKIQATVMRCIRAPGKDGHANAEIGVALLDPKRDAKVVAGILDRFAVGPASWNGKPISPEDTQSHLDLSRVRDRVAAQKAPENAEAEADHSGDSARSLPPSHAARTADRPQSFVQRAQRDDDRSDTAEPLAIEPDAAMAASFATPGGGGEASKDSDRRNDQRIPYDRRVVALGEEAARVLVGRDLSSGGMRISTNDAIEVGDVLRVALHCGTDLEPLVVLARALRSDEEDGTCLSFQDLSNEQHEHLEKIIASSSPIHAITDEIPSELADQAANPIVLGEMLETVERASARELDEDEAISRHIDSIFDANESV